MTGFFTAEVCRAHIAADCKICDEFNDDLWVHPRDLGTCRTCGNRYARENSFYDDESLCPACGDAQGPLTDVVAQAKAALDKIELPWVVDPDGTGGDPDWDDDELWLDVNGPQGGWVAHCQDRATAEFIAGAAVLIPALVAEVERLRAEAR